LPVIEARVNLTQSIERTELRWSTNSSSSNPKIATHIVAAKYAVGDGVGDARQIARDV
jgi:hypothetical protein